MAGVVGYEEEEAGHLGHVGLIGKVAVVPED